MEILHSTPGKDGFRMPGEFEEHAKTWMMWPERQDNWRKGAGPAQQAFIDVAVAIRRFEKLVMGVSRSQYSNAKRSLPADINVVEIENNDAWIRDTGPTFVVNDKKEVRAVDWKFNAWGGHVNGLYTSWERDDRVAQRVCELENISRYRTEDLVLEGGSIHADGEGTCIVTEACLLNKGRNPHLSKKDIEIKLKEYLNVKKIIWLKNGIYLDETNGHVDNIIHYCAPGVIALAWTDDRDDPQYAFSKDAYEVLSNTKDAQGRKFDIHKFHIPRPVPITKEESRGVVPADGTLSRNEGDRLAASYTNFYIVNGGVIYPTFNDPDHDNQARETLERIFPDRKIIGIYAREILLGGGNIHCITQQQPKV
ncbi:MAG: agmatine deiminase [Candidatus Marinimicrobia bacterium]|nr:agmatine deiminase [Candidatus Neomarinimicrobiota bacterium]